MTGWVLLGTIVAMGIVSFLLGFYYTPPRGWPPRRQR